MGGETNISQQIRLALSAEGCIVWRNNVGKLEDKRGRWVTFGLCVGSSDIIGMMPDGRFLAIEVKAPGEKPRDNQYAFIAAVQKQGGVAGWATSVEEAISIVRSAQ